MKLPIINQPSQTSFKLWEGRSKYNQDGIVAIVTNTKKPSQNPKTGPMSQLWILPKNEAPWQAIKHDGGDDGMCGDCIYAPRRAKRAREGGRKIPSCYVGRRAYAAPTSVWKSSAGKPVQLEDGLAAIEASGVPMRFGAYGDPAMLPKWLIKKIMIAIKRGSKNKTHTAYTHQYNRPWASYLKKYSMASVNNEFDAKLFQSLGWRTFRLTDKPEANDDEIICPNYTHKIQCIDCGLCDGKKDSNDTRKNITIPAH